MSSGLIFCLAIGVTGRGFGLAPDKKSSSCRFGCSQSKQKTIC
jgi:hypothetical protein